MDRWGLIFQPEKSVSQRLVLPRTVTEKPRCPLSVPRPLAHDEGVPHTSTALRVAFSRSRTRQRLRAPIPVHTGRCHLWMALDPEGLQREILETGYSAAGRGSVWRVIAATFAWVAHATAPDAHRPGCGRPDAAATARVRRSRPLWEPAGHPGRREATRGEGGHCPPHGPAHDAALRSATPAATGDSSAPPPPNSRWGPNSSLRPPGSDNSQRSKENDTPFTSTTPPPRLGPRLRVLPTYSRRLGLPVGSCLPQALRTHSYRQPLPHLCPAAPLGAQTAVSAPALGGGGRVTGCG